MIFTRYGLPCVFECPECRHIECWEEGVESGLPGSIQEARKRNNKKKHSNNHYPTHTSKMDPYSNPISQSYKVCMYMFSFYRNLSSLAWSSLC